MTINISGLANAYLAYRFYYDVVLLCSSQNDDKYASGL